LYVHGANCERRQRERSLTPSKGWDERVLRWSPCLVWLYKPVGCAAKKGEDEKREEAKPKRDEKKTGGRKEKKEKTERVEGDREVNRDIKKKERETERSKQRRRELNTKRGRRQKQG
jgi:hypothetical protein